MMKFKNAAEIKFQAVKFQPRALKRKPHRYAQATSQRKI